MDIEGPAALYGRTKNGWQMAEPLATWKSARLHVPKQMENSRPVRWNAGQVLLFGFRPGLKKTHTEIFEEDTHALARVDDLRAKRSCFVLVNLSTYASPSTDVLQLHTQGAPLTGPINGPAKEEPL